MQANSHLVRYFWTASIFPARNYTLICGSYHRKSKSFENRIPAIRPVPWLVSVQSLCVKDFNGQQCTGTLLDERHVLTAAHCVICQLDQQKKVNSRKFMRVALKEFNIDDELDEQEYINIQEVIIHPGMTCWLKEKEKNINFFLFILFSETQVTKCHFQRFKLFGLQIPLMLLS